MSERATGSARRRWARLGIVGLAVPLLAATVLVWSTTGREANLDRIPVAVVNGDTIIQKPQPMAAGRELAAALTEPATSDPNLDWTLADTQDAQAGLRDGDYYAVLTIPSDFSSSILSSGTNKPTQGSVQLTSNGAASSTVPFISRAIATAAATSMGIQTTQGYLDQVYDGFNQIASSNQESADSAAQLASGTDQLADGADSLDEGLANLVTSLDQLAAGASELATATDSVLDGTEGVASGAAGLTAGARDLHRGAEDLAGSARTLAHKSRDVAGAATRLSTGTARNAAGARAVARANRALADRVGALARLCDRIVNRDRIVGGVRPVRGDRPIRGDLVRRLCPRLDQARVATRRLAAGSTRVAIGSTAVAGGASGIADATSALAGGAGRLAGGAGKLDRASGKLAGSAGQLSAGAGSVASGARQLGSASDSVAQGASSAADGGDQLASGSSTLSSDAVSVDHGSNQLSQGLAKGAAKSPTYSKQQKKALETVVSEPVVLASATQHTQHGNGSLLALVLGLVLWLAAMLGVVWRDVGLVLRHAAAPISSGRLVSRQLGRAAGFALLQAVAVLAALPLLQVGTASAVPLALLTVLAAAAFTLLGVVLRWSLGWVGIAVFVLLLAVQAAALGNVIPLETAPGVLQTLNGILPLTAYVNGASQLVSGGEVGSLASVIIVLLVWSVLAALAAGVVVRRRRMAGPLPT